MGTTKTLLYRLFGVGKMPAEVMSQLQGEGILYVDEGIKASATYHNFRRPGKVSTWERRWFTASIALTNVRLFALWCANPIINVPLADQRIRSLRCTVEENGALCIALDAALFHSDWSGTIEYRFRTSEARHFIERVQERIR